MLSSSSSDSSDEEIRPPIRRPPRPIMRGDPFTEYTEFQFKLRFRFSKIGAREILTLIEENLAHLSDRNDPITPALQLLITLRFYATGTFQMCIGDLVNVSKSSVCRIIHRVTNSIASLRHYFIRLPDRRNEIRKIHNDFYEIAGFPNVLGAVDCTHIKVQSPGGDHGELYRNRKPWFSINTQAISDANLKFIDVVARWPGSVHDSTIFNDSRIRMRLENNEFPNCYLLGDSGYACKRYLLTPLLVVNNRAEQRYNTAHKTTRNVVERSFGVLKRRFPCLAIGLRVQIEKVLPIIIATMILHKISIDVNEDDPIEDPEIDIPHFEEPDDIFNVEIINNNENRAVRTALINTIFNR
jgi:hypothetical protein